MTKYHFLFKTLLAGGLLLSANFAQAEETLSCKLHVSTSTNMVSNIELPVASASLGAERFVGSCHFEDGRVADKQFVLVRRVMGDGSTGEVRGYSVYTLNDKDSLTLTFDGGWGKDGFNGKYTVLAGSGQYDGAKGSGEFNSVANQLPNTNIFDVSIRLE